MRGKNLSNLRVNNMLFINGAFISPPLYHADFNLYINWYAEYINIVFITPKI